MLPSELVELSWCTDRLCLRSECMAKLTPETARASEGTCPPGTLSECPHSTKLLSSRVKRPRSRLAARSWAARRCLLCQTAKAPLPSGCG